MCKKISAIVLTIMLILSLTACGGNNSIAPLDNKAESNSSVSESNSSIEKTADRNMPTITILQEGDNTAVVIEGDLVNNFSDIAKKDKDAEFLMEFEGDEEDKAHKKGFSLSFKFQNGDEPFGLFRNSVTNKGYSTGNEDILSITIKGNEATWFLSGMALPFDGVETVSIWLVSGDNEPIGEHYEMPIADVKMESNVNADEKEESNNSSAVGEKITANYIGTYLPEDEQGYQCVVVVEENKLTIDDRYVVEFTLEDADSLGRFLWSGLMTDTKTGKTSDAFLTLYSGGEMLLLHTYIDSKDIFIQSIKV